jgi:hypothetical protein
VLKRDEEEGVGEEEEVEESVSSWFFEVFWNFFGGAEASFLSSENRLKEKFLKGKNKEEKKENKENTMLLWSTEFFLGHNLWWSFERVERFVVL